MDDVLLCQKHKVKRIELNLALYIGGLTPSLGLAKLAREAYDGEIIAMLRPRAGGFIYNDAEMAVILEDLEALKPYVDGFVFGSLNSDKTIDIESLKKVRDLSMGKQLAFHRAFDLVDDYKKAIEQLIELKVDRVLTGGLALDCSKGLQTLKKMNEEYGDIIEILAGGGINAGNISMLHAATGIRQLHGSLRGYAYSLDTNNDNGLSYSYLGKDNTYDCLSEEKLVELLNSIN